MLTTQGLVHRPWRVLAGTHGLSLAQVPSPADTWHSWVTATGSPTILGMQGRFPGWGQPPTAGFGGPSEAPCQLTPSPTQGS